ncbi:MULTISPECIES: aldo/keto reductase [unclassified Undibacterium]|uniref:aldo/keto reductase n=1 Tax=unclassified Undibacterium TaxID=2630295 RepID=UPI002AC99A1E|nr:MULTISPECIES: aldo/keto reductase [unclassified Undibacterium]MEB0138237.1 aldo/keto reductase [Undibacterium sp. CCC2.1]MEB0171602.1 aldo/keto reductase [Undibacterium sp. CCC1.1]MEB0175478.1 aldo/keto reductase [Undibacterium sp. CCC3.4]MEB0214802.1 aldo/keto reductase [Undibacterium sp. 5I2]WPX45289.1 aldo/keto reductase [Undibacterium sp. CCC3.4]
MSHNLLSPRRQLAANGPDFSRIVLGLWRLADWNMTPQQRVTFLEEALALGITTIDQADIYGDYQSETLLGQAVQLAPSLRQRLQFVSKCGIKLVSSARPAHSLQHYDTSRAHLIASAEHSLHAMQIEQLDLLLIHRPDPLMDADEIAAAFSHLQDSGKVRHFGVSNFTPAQFDLLAARFPLVTNQLELSLMHLQPLHDGSLDLCQRLRCAPMIWSALGGGALFAEPATPAVLRVRSVLERLATEYAVSVTTVALSWILRHPSQPLVLTGSGRVAALRDAVRACDLELTREQWFALWSAAAGKSVD